MRGALKAAVVVLLLLLVAIVLGEAKAAATVAATVTVAEVREKASPQPALDGFLGYMETAKRSMYSLFGYPDDNAPKQPGPTAKRQRVPEITSADVAERVDISKELIQLGRVDEAIDVLLGVLEKDPAESDAYLPNMMVGTALLTVKNQAGMATGFLYEAVALSNWTDVTSIANLVAALTLERDAALAERVAMRGIDVAGEGAVYVLAQSLGRVNEARGNYSGAADWYLAAALRDPEQSVDPWVKASTLKFPAAEQVLEVAESVLLRAFPHHPNSAEVLFLLASVLHRRDRIAQSLPIYKRALALEPEHKEAHAMYATALHASARFDEALPAYQRAVELSPDNAVLMANYAICLCDQSVARFAIGRAAIRLAQGIAANATTTSPGVGAADIKTAIDMCGEEAASTGRKEVEVEVGAAAATSDMAL